MVISKVEHKYRFDPVEHEYWCDEEKMPSVTGIIGKLNDFSGIPPKVLKRKGELGTEFHRIISLHLQDDLVYDSIDDRLVRAFDSFLEWSAPRIKEFRSGIFEQQLYSKKLWLAGTCDLALPAELFDWKLRMYKPLIDILQLDGYDTLLGGGKRKRWTVCFDMKSGKMQVKRSENSQAHATFMSMLKDFHVLENWKGQF